MTIAQQFKIKDFPFEIKDKNGKEIYYEDSNGHWIKREYDANSKVIYSENSNGHWIKREYDANSKVIYSEHSDGHWNKCEYDANGKEIYYENSDGEIEDNRPKIVELTLDEIAAKLGINVNQLKIKK
jgi:hypothetical protein